MRTTTSPSGPGGNALLPERRSEMRRRVCKGAKLSFNGGFGALECVLRDQSGRGARLKFGDASAVPTRFELSIAGEAGLRTAHVRWRGLNTVGVFLG